ncbi:hypothetical protein C8F04DRAFT_1085782, partial [Mycena alexandri]
MTSWANSVFTFFILKLLRMASTSSMLFDLQLRYTLNGIGHGSLPAFSPSFALSVSCVSDTFVDVLSTFAIREPYSPLRLDSKFDWSPGRSFPKHLWLSWSHIVCFL